MIDWNDKRIKDHEDMMDYKARIYYGAELTPKQKKRQVEAQKKSEQLRRVLFGSVEDEITKHFELINDRIKKSIEVGGTAIFIHPYTNHVINTAHTMEEYFRLASDNGNAIIVYNRPDGRFIPNNEPIRE